MEDIKELVLDCGVTVQVSSGGKIYKDGKECKVRHYPSGYCYVTFKSHYHYLVHKLVASAFIRTLERGDRTLQVHHINEDKNDNRVENLQVLTVLEHQGLHKQKYPFIKRCVICGKDFIPNKTKRNRNQTCSWECSRILSKQKVYRRSIAQYTLDGQLIKVWESARAAQLELRIYESNINKCCNGHIKTYKGYVWKYYD